MILVDANIPLYTINLASPHHEKARRWWDKALSGSEPICLCWPVISAFIRISTNHRVFKKPLGINESTDIVQSWLDQPCVRVISPTEDHWSIFSGFLKETQGIGNLVSDAHLAALATEHRCWLFSADTDFARFRALKWKNPLA